MTSKIFNDRSFFLMAAIAISIFVVFGRSSQNSIAAPFDGKPEVIAATFTSEWCTACKILEPRLADVIPAFTDKPVHFLELDFSFGQKEKARAVAVSEGFETAYNQFEGATGFTLLIDKDSGEIIDILTASYSESAMKAALANALAVASVSDGQ